MLQENEEQFFFEPFCCSCGKNSETVKSTIMSPGTPPVYWFLFSNPTNPDSDLELQEAQNIQTILNEVERKNKPQNPESFGGGKVAFLLKTTKTFNYDLKHNCLCPDCAKEYMIGRIRNSQNGDDPVDNFS